MMPGWWMRLCYSIAVYFVLRVMFSLYWWKFREEVKLYPLEPAWVRYAIICTAVIVVEIAWGVTH